ncbi:serine/threonine-protein kinase [Streptomyces sp. NPDC059786]|uniref:serine/threonine-protein kinase n=1 Tax=Streptomyces sp. NPDC059786 TaxID=3346946 RepID=UPI00365B3626
MPRDQERKVAGRYRLLSLLGEGGMGTVWRAWDETLHREVAVKEVRAPTGPAAASVETERLYKRLEREAWAAARIVSPHVVTVHDVAHDDGRPWIVMELVRGRSLEDLLRDEGPLPARRVAQIGVKVLSALRAAHAVGVLHRDVKPANVLLSHDGRVVLTDFGIATVEGDSSLTMAGQVVGSPEYLPPERALGRTPGPASDLWSLGALLYASVEGAPPFRRDTAFGTLRAVVEEQLPAPRRAGPLTAVIVELLRKEPAERLPAELAEEYLRLIAAGGMPPLIHPATVAVPTIGTFVAPTAGPGTLPAATPTGPGTFSAQPAPPRQHRTKRGVVVAAAMACALVVAGLTYAWVGRSHEGPRADQAATPSDPASSASTGEDAAATSPAVRVTVAGENTTYVGHCPASAEEAPTFTATFTVDRTPARITYRWVTEDGSVVDRQWRALAFPRGGDQTKREAVRLTGYAKAGILASEIGVQVKGSEETFSNKVPFSVTCQ